MRLLLAVFLAAAHTAVAAVRVGDNLLANSIFESDQLEVPGCWNMTGGKDFYVWSANGGPNAAPAVTFDASRADGPGSFCMRQGGFRLLPGGRYRVSGWVRAKDFGSKRCGIVVANTGWQWSDGIRIDAYSGGWKRFSADLVAESSRNDSWTVILFADDFSGRIELADVRLVPLDERTAAGTRLSDKAEAVESPRLVPMDRLHSIPKSARAVAFRYFGRLDGGVEADYDVRVEIGGKASARKLVRERTAVPLPPGPDAGEMKASVVRRRDGAELFVRRYAYRVVDVPANPTTGERLNGLVEEYVRRRLKPGGSGTIKLAFDRDVWLFVSAAAQKVEFDGREIIGPDVPEREAFVEASVGEHRLSVQGAEGGELVVRRIPEILDYQIGAADLRNYARRSMTTMCCGGVDPADWALFKKTGHVRIGNVSTSNLKSAADLARIIDGSKFAADPVGYEGVSCDEQGPWKAKMMSDYAQGLWEYAGRPGFRIYSWVVSKPFYAAANADLLSAAVNVSGGRGRFMNEIYCIAKPTEDETRVAARDWMVGNYRAWRDLLPLAKHGYAPIFGAFVRMNGGWTLSPYPDVDFRYVLDLVFNVLVNEPEMADLPMTGVWGSNYSGLELKRWTFRLFRHYLIEGKRTMLSAECGLKFHPGHLGDGDFAAGASSWRTAGDVKFDRVKGFGDKCEFRGGRQKLEVGDTFAVLRRKGGVAAEVSQKAVGLIPGRRYRLAFRSFFADEARSLTPSGRSTGVRAKISGGEIAETLPPPSEAKVNWHEIVFTAKAPEAEIALTTADSPDGEEIGVNFVGLFVVLED